MFRKGNQKHCFAYEAHTACDEHGFVLATVVTAGNVHDSVAFHPLHDWLTTNFPQIHAVVADTAYKTPYICKRLWMDAFSQRLANVPKPSGTVMNGTSTSVMGITIVSFAPNTMSC